MRPFGTAKTVYNQETKAIFRFSAFRLAKKDLSCLDTISIISCC